MDNPKYPKLSIMMLLQYMVWGAWLPVAARFLSASSKEGGLGFSGAQIGMILGLAGSIGAVSAPFIAGQLADRYFSTERFMAFLLLIGGIVKWITASQSSYGAWLVLSILYSVIYTPTLALSNSLAFAHMKDANKEFPYVRVWGTIGWIVASWIFPMIWLQKDLKFQLMPPFLVGPEVDGVTHRLVDSLRFSGVISFGYAAFCLLLPHTPPKKNAVESLAFAKAFALLKRPSFAILVAASLPISAIHQIYFLQTGPFFSHLGIADSKIGPVLTVAQFAEIIVITSLGFMLKKLGFRWVVFVGGMAYFARYAIFGTVDLPVPLIVCSQALHGFCYSCFFAASFIYVDRIAEADVRHSAQTVFGIIILGGGPVLGGFLSGKLQELFTPEGGSVDYSKLWYTLSAIGLITSVAFAAFFRDETKDRVASLTLDEATEESEVV